MPADVNTYNGGSPHLLDTTALANDSLDTYLVENAVHALHLQSNMGATSSVLYGEEQRRSSSLWHTTGIVDSYVPNRLPSINKHYSSKRVKVDKKEPVVKSEVPPSAVVSTWPSDVKSQSGPPSVVNNTVAAGATAIAINPASLVSSLAPQPIKSEHPSTIASFEIPEERFQQLRRAENQILLQRRGIFTKRDKRKTTKKIKRNETPVKPTVIINERVPSSSILTLGKRRLLEPEIRLSYGCTTFVSVVGSIGGLLIMKLVRPH
ncbi:hypothetical protein MHU86_10714 [Fragilaria crotonensis]|nr:hypothetical protein MHU86_10714 [Fragilaria crotonensis]